MNPVTMKQMPPEGADHGVTARGGERGVALVIVLVMLLLLSILGSTMLATSTSDLQIAGNYRNSEEAFYAADAGLELGHTIGAIYTTFFNGVTTWPTAGGGKVLDANFNATGTASADPNYNTITIPGTSDKALVRVQLVNSGNLPPGTGTQEDAGLSPGMSFKANYFVVSVKGEGPPNTNSQVEVESQIARVVQQ